MTISWSINIWSIPYFYSISALNIFLSGSHPRYYVFHQHNEILKMHVFWTRPEYKSSDCDSFISNKSINISFGCNCSQYVTGRAFRCNPGNALSLSLTLSLSLSAPNTYICVPLYGRKGVAMREHLLKFLMSIIHKWHSYGEFAR